VEGASEAGREFRGEAFGGLGSRGEQQFVVLARAGRRADVGARSDGDAFDLHLGADPRSVEDVPQVGGETVGKVHHGVHLLPGPEPEALGDLRLRVAVHGGQRSVAVSGEDVPEPGSRGAQLARGEDHVAGTRVAAAFEVRRRGAADGRDVDRDARLRTGRVASYEGRAERFGQLPVALHELRRPCAGGVGRKGDGEERGDGAGAHRGDIAEVYGKGFASQLPGRSGGAQEVDALGQQVGGEDQRFAAAEGQHGAVVADAFEPVVGEGGEAGAYLLDKSEFGHVYFVLLRAKVPKFAENSYLRQRRRYSRPAMFK